MVTVGVLTSGVSLTLVVGVEAVEQEVAGGVLKMDFLWREVGFTGS